MPLNRRNAVPRPSSSSSLPSTAPTYPTGAPPSSSAALLVHGALLVDTGSPAGNERQQIVALLLEEGLLGGFHFNNRKYADDDPIVGSIDPFELFRIMSEMVSAKRDPTTATTADAIAYMIDQSHNIEGKIEAMVQSVVNFRPHTRKHCSSTARRYAKHSSPESARRSPGADRRLRDRRASDPSRPFGRSWACPLIRWRPTGRGHEERLAQERA